jgi:predicted Zn-dependent peptidase
MLSNRIWSRSSRFVPEENSQDLVTPRFSNHKLVAWPLLHRGAMLTGLLLLMALMGLPVNASATEYDPTGLYDVDYFKLKNGVDVVLKKRTHARNVAVRLVVNVGFRHFPCDKRETPHFLEHLLFMGTSKHSEAELKRLIEDHGGSWNGFTAEADTGYQVDIYDQHLPLAINTLYEIITDTIITPEKIESAREVIYRERGGKYSWLTRWFYRNGIFKDAATKGLEALLPGTGVHCPGVVTPEGIGESDVRETYKNYYVPSNMALVVVGNFNRDTLVSQIESTFGQLTPKAANDTKLITPPYMTGTKEVTGTFSPLIGQSGEVGLAYRTDGSNSPDTYALWVLWKYLDRVLYERIRVKEAMSYGPGSGYSTKRDYGIFVAAADVDLDKIEVARGQLEEEVEKAKQGQIAADHLKNVKERILWELAQSYESNSSMAGFYMSSLSQLRTRGKLTNHEATIARLTPQDIQRVAKKNLRNDSRIIVRSTPTMTFTQFYIGLGVFALVAPSTCFYFVRRFIKKRRSSADDLAH